MGRDGSIPRFPYFPKALLFDFPGGRHVSVCRQVQGRQSAFVMPRTVSHQVPKRTLLHALYRIACRPHPRLAEKVAVTLYLLALQPWKERASGPRAIRLPLSEPCQPASTFVIAAVPELPAWTPTGRSASTVHAWTQPTQHRISPYCARCF